MTEVLNQPALDQAPKTLRAALKRALAYAKKNNLSTCMYRNAVGNPCIVGQFFTGEQIDEIVAAGHNGMSVFSVASKFGRKNIQAMTGMSVDQAEALQRLNDKLGKTRLIEEISAVLKTGNGVIFNTHFDLRAKACE